MTDQVNDPGGSASQNQGQGQASGNPGGQSAEERQNLAVDLESSFQISFRSTHTDLKKYALLMEGENQAAKPSAVTAPASDQGQTGENSAGVSATPPAATHAPHHTWLLGSFGGKKKPQSIKAKPGSTVADLSLAIAMDKSAASDIELLKRIASASNGSKAIAKQSQDPDSLPPRDFAIPQKALDATIEPAPYAVREDDALDLEESSANLFAPTIDVSLQAISWLDFDQAGERETSTVH